jgi:hypothetical protein
MQIHSPRGHHLLLQRPASACRWRCTAAAAAARCAQAAAACHLLFRAVQAVP